jgi:hypothetical protein
MAMGLGNREYETVRVAIKARPGKFSVIRAEDFDPSLHEKAPLPIQPAPQAESQPEQQATPVQKRESLEVGSATEQNELSKMTIEALMKLPEWSQVPGRGSITKKDKIVEAILAVRNGAKG